MARARVAVSLLGDVHGEGVLFVVAGAQPQAAVGRTSKPLQAPACVGLLGRVRDLGHWIDHTNDGHRCSDPTALLRSSNYCNGQHDRAAAVPSPPSPRQQSESSVTRIWLLTLTRPSGVRHCSRLCSVPLARCHHGSLAGADGTCRAACGWGVRRV